MEEHPISQPIRGIDLPDDDGRLRSYSVGRSGVTRIEACQKSGLHANIPYVRVWIGDNCEAEFCQHNTVGVYFADTPPPKIIASPYACPHAADSFDCPECRPF